MKSLCLVFCGLVLAGVTICAADSSATPAPSAPLLYNGGFEEGATGWSMFVPEESKPSNCRFDVIGDSPHSGAKCLRFQSDDFGRFSVGPALSPVQAGDHYRVSVWVRADSATEVRPKAPGFVIRLYLGQSGIEAPAGHLFIAPGNRVTRGTPADPVAETLPTTWTKIEAVVEVPAGVDTMGPSLFAWWTKGNVYADDFSIEKIDASTPATALWQKDGSAPSAPAPK